MSWSKMIVLSLFVTMFVAGCNMFDSHIKQEDLLRGMASDASMRLKDGSISQMQVSGQGLNPGVTVEAALVYKATAKYEGIAGQFSAASQGTLGDRVTADQILAIINDKSLTDAGRWEKVQSLYSTIVGTTSSDDATTTSTSTQSATKDD